MSISPIVAYTPPLQSPTAVKPSLLISTQSSQLRLAFPAFEALFSLVPLFLVNIDSKYQISLKNV